MLLGPIKHESTIEHLDEGHYNDNADRCLFCESYDSTKQYCKRFLFYDEGHGICDKFQEEVILYCPICGSPLEENGSCLDVGSNNCQYQK